MLKEAQYWVDKLGLEPHPEGGFFKETYRSEGKIPGDEKHNYSTAIYFLLLENNFSAFHRIKQDELWHFYAGSPIDIYILHQSGELVIKRVGSNPENNESFQAMVPAHTWFASCMAKEHTYGLVGCTVAPGFDFDDFELAGRNELISQYPQHQQVIKSLTR